MGIWKQAASNITTYPPFELHGWKLKDNVLAIDWDSEEHMSQVRSRVALMKKGCGCKLDIPPTDVSAGRTMFNVVLAVPVTTAATTQ